MSSWCVFNISLKFLKVYGDTGSMSWTLYQDAYALMDASEGNDPGFEIQGRLRQRLS